MTGRRAAVFVASGALILSACGAFEADSGPSVTDAGGNAGDAGADASDATSGACDPKFPDDFAGCGCEGASVRDCSHVTHVTSPSACGRGSQRCESGRWSACTPIGSAPLDPRSAEVCFDTVDDDCNGKVDDGCPGSGDVDLCTSGGSERPPLVAFTDKTTYARGEIIQMFVLWKTGTIESVQIARTSGVFHCAGGAGGIDVAIDPGKGCKGWSAHRRTIDTKDLQLTPSGSVTLTAYINALTAAPCTGEAARTAATVTVN